jgi:hypothetical protein
MEKVKMKNVEVIGLVDSLNSLIGANVPLSPRSWFTLTANRKALLDQQQSIDETRLELVKKYGEEDGKGGKRVKDEMIETFTREYNEVLALDTEVNLHKLPLTELEKEAKKLSGVSNIYLMFDYIIESDDQPTKKNGKRK